MEGFWLRSFGAWGSRHVRTVQFFINKIKIELAVMVGDGSWSMQYGLALTIF